MTITLAQWGIRRGLECLAEAEGLFDQHAVGSGLILLADGGLAPFDRLTDLRREVRRAVWNNDLDSLPLERAVCQAINGALQLLLDAGCLAERDGPVGRLVAALLQAAAALHLVAGDDDDRDDDAGEPPAGDGPPAPAILLALAGD